MARTRSEVNAIMSAANWLSEGKTLTLGTKAFWSQWPGNDTYERVNILQAAIAVRDASKILQKGGSADTAADVAADVGYPLEGGEAGPLDTGLANVFGKIEFWQGDVLIAVRSFSETYPWGTTLEQIYADIGDIIDAMKEEYGLSGGMVSPGSLVFL